MGHTNTTPNYNLPQFLGSDKPAWLTDVNNAMSAIDTAIAAAKAAADNASGAAAALATTVGGHTTQLETLSNTVTNQGASIVSQGNAINTISELIGNGTPTTTDHTLIGAINELNAKEGNLADLQTTDKSSLVAAINEAAQSGGGGTGETVEVTGDGSKTRGQLLDALFALVDMTKIKKNTTLKYVYAAGGVEYFAIAQNDNVGTGSIIFNRTIVNSAGNGLNNYCNRLKASGSRSDEVNTVGTPAVTFTDKTSTVVASGDKFIVEY